MDLPCNILSANMEKYKTIDILPQKSPSRSNFVSEEDVIHVVIKSKGLLYTLDTSSLVVTAYHFTPKKLQMLSSVKINSMDLGAGQRVSMATDTNEETLYIFSERGMWSIKTITVLTNVNIVGNLNGY